MTIVLFKSWVNMVRADYLWFQNYSFGTLEISVVIGGSDLLKSLIGVRSSSIFFFRPCLPPGYTLKVNDQFSTNKVFSTLQKYNHSRHILDVMSWNAISMIFFEIFLQQQCQDIFMLCYAIHRRMSI